ncbi:uncharacterized protein [Argopecten irradians]|uniref:uncharacterized protein n=1 Tax=Argopecten irradians TaxID=31199 RepID=UPI00372267A0
MAAMAVSIPALKGYLQQRGISFSLGRRMDLIRLATLAEEMNLEVLTSTDDYDMMDEARRTVGKDAVVLPSVTAVSKWSKDLRSLPDIEHCDILIHFMRKCEWTNDRLKMYDGYQLYTANHIGDAELAIVDSSSDHDCMYVSATCVPETRQTAAPYKVWILMNARTAEIMSGGCTCVVDNGTCKHCVALLFSLSSFGTRHKDRSTEVCIDVECVWDKPRKTSEPMEIEHIDIRSDPSTSAPYVPTRNNYTPHLSCTSQREVEKELYEMCKGTDGLLLQTLDPPSDEGEDEAPLRPPTMLDFASAENDGMSFIAQLSVSFDSRTFLFIYIYSITCLNRM